MALMKGIGLFLVGLATAVLSRIASDEFAATAPLIARRIAKIAAAKLPESQRERFDEEWQSHVDEIPGNIRKLCSAASLLLRARKVGRAMETAGAALELRLRLVTESDASLTKVKRALRLIDRKMGSASRDVRNKIRPRRAAIMSQIKKYQDLREAWISEIRESAVPSPYRIIRVLREFNQRRVYRSLSRTVRQLNAKADLVLYQLGGRKETKTVR